MNRRATAKKSDPSKMAEDQMAAKTSFSVSWEYLLERHRLFLEHNFWPIEGIRDYEVEMFAREGDFVTQCFLSHLRQRIPELGEIRRPVVGDGMEDLLLRHVQRLNETLCDLARLGRWQAGEVLFEQALLLAQTFGELAVKNPRPFRAKARRSLYMASVRTKNPKFTADAKAIAGMIQLSADTVGARLTDNRVRLGALCARLVGECVHQITLVRNRWMRGEQHRPFPLVWPTLKQIEPYVGRSVAEIIALREASLTGRHQHTSDRAQRHFDSKLALFAMNGRGRELHFLCLPDLSKATEGTWWKQAIEPMVEEKFPALMDQPVWLNELKAVTDGGTDSAMLKALKDYSRKKVRQFAGK